MRYKVKEKTKEYVAKDQCRHYWVIEVANGPKSRGLCKYCGEEREFFNSIPNLTSVKRRPHPFNLPEMADVALDKGSKS